ncbi:hypothetical protein [Agromyces archimandritae]|uniref:Uncharacterized protein n=1 Tax=Agromyces archimandritae TaxID=2781962 RepID=A0A975FL42_9MICO|nr:hypothetical protein [Agromyces archimandritae]QTX04090.1 hypothetical protein G127AT_12425 [Agromyces archimandritae]
MRFDSKVARLVPDSVRYAAIGLLVVSALEVVHIAVNGWREAVTGEPWMFNAGIMVFAFVAVFVAGPPILLRMLVLRGSRWSALVISAYAVWLTSTLLLFPDVLAVVTTVVILTVVVLVWTRSALAFARAGQAKPRKAELE